MTDLAPGPDPRPEPRQPLTTLEIVMQWAQLPPEHLAIAMSALEPELARQQERELELARLRHADRKDARTHRLYAGGLVAGFLLALGMLSGAVAFGLRGHEWLAGVFSGPSMLSLAALFVLRKVDAGAVRASATVLTPAIPAPAAAAPDPYLAPTPPGPTP